MHKFKIISTIALLALAACAQTNALQSDDVGTYVALDGNNRPTKRFYRMRQCDNGWVMDSKHSQSTWCDINCHNSIAFRKANKKELERFLSADWRAKNTTTCVRGENYAFCRYHPKAKPKKTAHLMLLLFTNGAIIRPLQRVDIP